MDYFEKWNITDQGNRLPYSNRVDISILLQVFSNTATSYKYLYFRALMNILAETHFNQLSIRLDEILLEMLAIAWYPHTFFKLSFGTNDRIAEELERLELLVPYAMTWGEESKNRLKAIIAQKDYFRNDLLRFVPYRLIRPFFANRMIGVNDSSSNNLIMGLACKEFDETRPFYFIAEDRRSIIMHPDWMLYFFDNYTLVQAFIAWNWLDYMQRRNPSVPNLQTKLFPPVIRKPIENQKIFWKTVLKHHPTRCIFSDEPIQEQQMSLDHFLPWSFVAHDQLWNLIPVSRSINSAKSNNLPSLSQYFKRFADLQYIGLRTYRDNPGTISWNKITEPYIADLHMRPADLLDRQKLYLGLKTTMEPLYALAASQGFPKDWQWKPDR
ncbi:HNH endonuclease domain-containing protein [Pleomorphochaeta sp. DL1XJH-081]|uniref:HNH endonuclease domain-containing protein n=1 Tax=Pleomorphochaeta sp. DL1XJH-081 TaxID=3409690 RepID=UPI003BB5A30C